MTSRNKVQTRIKLFWLANSFTSSSLVSSVCYFIRHFLNKFQPFFILTIHLTQNPKRKFSFTFLGTRRCTFIMVFDFSILFQTHVKLDTVMRSCMFLVLLLSFLQNTFTFGVSITVSLLQIWIRCIRLEQMCQGY